MKKAMRIVSMLCAVLLLFGGCATQSNLAQENGYRCYKSDGQYYITMDVDIETLIPNGANVSIQELEFQDFEELRRDFLTGNFSEFELEQLKCNMALYYCDPMPIVDLDNFPQIVYPECYYLSYVSCTGPDMDMILRNKNADLKGVRVIFDNYWGRSENWINDVDPEPRIEFYKSKWRVEVEYEEDRNATVVRKYSIPHYAGNTYFPETLEGTSCFYSFTKGNTVYHVVEEYIGNEEEIREVRLVVQDGDNVICFEIGVDERPSIEFLSQFGFEPYKG